MNDPRPINAWISPSRKKIRLIIKYDRPLPGKKTRHRSTTLNCDAATAQKVLRQVLNDIELNRFEIQRFSAPTPGAQFGLGELRNKYLAHRRSIIGIHSDEISEDTYRMDELATRTFMKYIGEETPLEQIDRNAVRTFVNEFRKAVTRYGTRPRPRTINVYLNHTSGMFSFAVDEGLIQVNPIRGFKRLKTPDPKDEIRPYSFEEQERLLSYFNQRGTLGNLAIEFSIETGVRAGGIVNANRNNLFQDMVDDDLQQFITITEKGLKTRDIPLSARAFEIVQILIRLADNPESFITNNLPAVNRKIYISRIKAGNLFFFYSNADSVSRMFKRASLATGVQGVFHNCRDTFATRFLNTPGNSIETLSKILGHRSIQTTLNHYGHISRAKMAREIQRIEKK